MLRVILPYHGKRTTLFIGQYYRQYLWPVTSDLYPTVWMRPQIWSTNYVINIHVQARTWKQNYRSHQHGPSPYQVLSEVGFYCDKSWLKKTSHTVIHTDIQLEGIQHKTPYYKVSTNDWYQVTWIILAMKVIANCHIGQTITFNILLAFLGILNFWNQD